MRLSDTDLTDLENAMRLFFQTIKRPQHWAVVTERAGMQIDRPAAVILHILAAQPKVPCGIQDIALRLGIEAPSVTRKTQALEQAGYLRRTPNPDDKRAISLLITTRGKKASQRFHKAQREIIGQALSSWQPTDRRRFIELFDRFTADLAQTAGTSSTYQSKPKGASLV